MGIHLSDSYRQMIGTVASLRADACPASGYMFGYLKSRVDQFAMGAVDAQQLIEDNAFLELLWTLSLQMTPDELREIAAGTRELPGEDVQSDQSE